MGASVNTEFGKCFIIVFYRFKTSIDSLTNIITKYISSPCIIMGDFNLNCFEYDSD